MIINNGMRDEPISAVDLDTISVNPKRFVFKCHKKLWDDVLYEAVQLALASGTVPNIYTDVYEEIVSDAELHIGFHIQKKYVRPYADLFVTTVSGESVSKRFPVSAKNEEIANILDHVIANNCHGVSPEFAEYFISMYLTWKKYEKN